MATLDAFTKRRLQQVSLITADSAPPAMRRSSVTDLDKPISSATRMSLTGAVVARDTRGLRTCGSAGRGWGRWDGPSRSAVASYEAVADKTRAA